MTAPTDRPSAPGEITVLLRRAATGDASAQEALLTELHGQLRQLAGRHLRRERRDHTLQPTALVNEAYLRLIHGGEHDWHDRVHFFAMASTVMRRILVDHARSRTAEKRGGGAR
jgi:RNA polymerase sigma-70 factor, ECF subfamily